MDLTDEKYGQKTEDAAKALNVDKSSLVKSLIFLDEDNAPSNGNEVLALTNHPIGGVPPNHDFIYSSAGSPSEVRGVAG